MSKHRGNIIELLLAATVVMWYFLVNAMGAKWFEVPKEIVEYNDTDTIAFGLTTGRSIQEIASSVSNVTVVCQRHTKRWDNGLNLTRIHGFQRIASFDDQDDFIQIMEKCRRNRNEEDTGGSSVYRRDLPMYYIIFHYRKQGHIMVFPVKFDENLRGNISPWSKTNYTYSNKDLFRWLEELDRKSGEKTESQANMVSKVPR